MRRSTRNQLNNSEKLRQEYKLLLLGLLFLNQPRPSAPMYYVCSCQYQKLQPTLIRYVVSVSNCPFLLP